MRSREKAKRFENDLSYYGLLSLFTQTIWLPKMGPLPKIGITVYAVASLILWVVTIFVYLLILNHPLVLAIGYAFLTVTLVGTVLAGDNGRRFARWMGISAVFLRKQGVPAQDTPISLAVTRVILYGIFSLEIAWTIWWQVFTADRLTILEVVDPLVAEIAKQEHALNQLMLYWWLMPVLWLITAGALKSVERFPVIGFVLRRTRFLTLVIPMIAYLILRTALAWYDAALGPTV